MSDLSLASAATATAIAFCKVGVAFRFSSVTDKLVSAFSERRFQISVEGVDEWRGSDGSGGSESAFNPNTDPDPDTDPGPAFVLASAVTVFDMTSGGGGRKDVERGGRTASVLLIGAGATGDSGSFN